MGQHDDATQNLRAILLVAGALIAVIGMSQDNSVLIYIAFGILAVGAVLAIVRRAKNRKGEV